MGWGWALLAASFVNLLFVVNGYRSVRWGPLSVLSFFLGWPVIELPLFQVMWQAIALAGFIWAGALNDWPGWVGLGLLVIGWAGFIGLAVRASRSSFVLSAATESLAKGVHPLTGRETMWKLPRLLYPLPRPATSVRVHRNIDYVGDRIHRHRLDVIVRRADPPTRGPVLIYVHGGAWIIGDKREQGLPMLHELARRGWVTVTINYRRGGRATWPDHIVDVKRAIAWVRDHIAEFGGDPGFLAISGGSAGGHLCSLAALTPGDPDFQPGFEDADTHVDACVPFYGVYDMTGEGKPREFLEGMRDQLLAPRVFRKTYEQDPGAYRAASPIHRIHPSAPPFFVIHGTIDTLVPIEEARRFVANLRAVSTSPVLFAELPGTQHAFDVLPGVRTAHAISAVVRFLEAIRTGLRGKAQNDEGVLSNQGPSDREEHHPKRANEPVE